jgi:hypothetical protein
MQGAFYNNYYPAPSGYIVTGFDLPLQKGQQQEVNYNVRDPDCVEDRLPRRPDYVEDFSQ